MSDQLKVDLGVLQQIASGLRSLTDEFEQSSNIVDGAAGEVGEQHLVDALHEFADNWKAHREHLLSSMKAVADMAQKSHDTYLQADQQLAAALVKAMRHATMTIHTGGH